MKISYTNFRKEFPNMGKRNFQSWFFIKRYWKGKLICIVIKHHQITLDFRGDLVKEMTGE